MSDIDRNALKQVAKDMLGNAPAKRKAWAGMAIPAIAGAVIAGAMFAREVNIGNTHSTVDMSQSIVVNQNVMGLRQWRELPLDERRAIKAEARMVFPQIERIGEGVSWRPVAEWLAEEKGVAVSNVRDLFR